MGSSELKLFSGIKNVNSKDFDNETLVLLPKSLLFSLLNSKIKMSEK